MGALHGKLHPCALLQSNYPERACKLLPPDKQQTFSHLSCFLSPVAEFDFPSSGMSFLEKLILILMMSYCTATALKTTWALLLAYFSTHLENNLSVVMTRVKASRFVAGYTCATLFLEALVWWLVSSPLGKVLNFEHITVFGLRRVLKEHL